MRSSVIIRCDGSAKIGMGHVVRMLSIARALRDEGADPIFVFSRDSSTAIEAVHSGGFLWHSTGGDSESLDPSDAKELVTVAKKFSAKTVIVDQYGADGAYLKLLKAAGLIVGVIDDLNDRDLTAASWILNPSPASHVSDYPSLPATQLLLGPAFALLRPSFAAVRERMVRHFDANDRRILVTFGGGDVQRYTHAVLTALKSAAGDLEVRSPHGVSDVEMAELMAWADVSVNAGGQTCWELCCLGVPMIVFTIDQNQNKNAEAVEAFGVGKHLGCWADGISPKSSADAITRILSEPDRRRSFSEAGRALVDGRGAERAAREIVRWAHA